MRINETPKLSLFSFFFFADFFIWPGSFSLSPGVDIYWVELVDKINRWSYRLKLNVHGY